MPRARRLIAIFTGFAMWCMAAATVAFADVVPEPPLVGDQWWKDVPTGSSTSAAGTPLWQTLAFVALGILVALAIVGLGYSLRGSRSQGTQPRLHA